MNADAFRHLYGYHFSENHKIWGYVPQLSDEQLTQEVAYSHGSVRDQILHLIDAEEIWFRELGGMKPSQPFPSCHFDDRKNIRAYWDGVEQIMQDYLQQLRDDMLFSRPIQEPDEDRNLIVWQVLLHVVNHATDHRAQILRQLSDLGVKTTYQDYIFYVYEHP
jgi:uncharacterized damage-inducible protein DinB